MWIKGSLLGLTVFDLDGSPAGYVVDTYPCDGSSPEFALVRAGRFAEKVLVPLGDVWPTEEGLQVPYTRAEIEDAPLADSARYHDERVSRARAYWSMQGGERPTAPMSITRQ
jgi:hypothetical protein